METNFNGPVKNEKKKISQELRGSFHNASY